MIDPQIVKERLEEALPGAKVTIASDGKHFRAEIVYEGFKGKSLIEQHRMVYAILGEDIDNDVIHALALSTKAE